MLLLIVTLLVISQDFTILIVIKISLENERWTWQYKKQTHLHKAQSEDIYLIKSSAALFTQAFFSVTRLLTFKEASDSVVSQHLWVESFKEDTIFLTLNKK